MKKNILVSLIIIFLIPPLITSCYADIQFIDSVSSTLIIESKEQTVYPLLYPTLLEHNGLEEGLQNDYQLGITLFSRTPQEDEVGWLSFGLKTRQFTITGSGIELTIREQNDTFYEGSMIICGVYYPDNQLTFFLAKNNSLDALITNPSNQTLELDYQIVLLQGVWDYDCDWPGNKPWWYFWYYWDDWVCVLIIVGAVSLIPIISALVISYVKDGLKTIYRKLKEEKKNE